MGTVTTGRPLPSIFDPGGLAEWMLDNEPPGGWTAEEIRTACIQVGRNAAPALLVSLHHGWALTRAAYVALVAEIWSMAEYPLCQIDPDEWAQLFTLAGYTRTLDGSGLARRWPRPRKPRTLYRGASEAARLGWSWTDSPAVARWFAERPIWPEPGRVWVVTVDPSALLARIDGRRESEYVIDARRLDPGAVTAYSC